MNQSFGSYLQQARLAKGLSQTEVARKLGYSTPQFVSNFERGICAPAEEKMPKLMKLLGLDKKKTKVEWALYQYQQVNKRADRVFGVSK